MTVGARREEVERLYTRARELQPAARAAFVQEASHDNPELRDEVLSLLERTEAAEGFFHNLSKTMPSPALSTDLAVPSEDLPVGQEIGHYRILGRIGAGGMGTVYRARDTRLDREVALKFLPAHLSASNDAGERLLMEAKAAAALDHGNVCTVHEIGQTDDGRPFIAMALYEGETLKDRLRPGPLPPEEAVGIAAQIARGLEAAHAHGITHRDVKPGNVMLTVNGTVKLLDFGLAKVADATLTRPGATPGTVAYMSPEQARGDPLDRRTDLWSLGVVLYEMLAGTRPFRGGNDRALIQAILHEEPEPLRKHAPDTPESMQRIVNRLLGKKPETRYGSAGELLADLEQARSGSPASPLASRGRWIPRTTTRRVALGAAGVLVALAFFLGIRTMGDADAFVPVPDTTGAAPAIAVLPFSVHGKGLEMWREGMVDLLSTGLDGAGGLRAIDSRTVLARWNEGVDEDGMADLTRALGIARRTQARYALVGSAVAAGPQLRLAADIYDLGSGRSLGTALVEGSPDSVLALVDRLGMQALRVVFEEARERLPTIDLASVTTTSLPALKTFLEGEVRFRRSDFLGAIEAWERAVAADTLFALAYVRLVEAYGWDEGGVPGKYQEMLDRAHSLADRLPAREARLVRAKRLRQQGWLEGITALEEIVREHPDDAEAWYELGEPYYHDAGAMQGPEEAERAFQRAAELQPASAPYRAHLIDLAFGWRPDSARIARELEAYGRLAPQGQRTYTGGIAFGLAFGGPDARARARAGLDTLDPKVAIPVYLFLRHPRFAAEREAVYLAFGSRLHDEGDLPRWIRFMDVGAVDGQVREALSSLDDPLMSANVRWCGPLQLSVLGLPVPAEILEETLSPSSADSSAFDSQVWVTCAVAYATGRGRWSEHAALLSHARERARKELAAGDTASARQWNRTVLEAEAHGLWRRGRKAEALSSFESLLSSHTGASWVVWYVGQLAFELGRWDLAERAFRARWNLHEPPAYLYLGRIYERTGRTAEAVEAYEFAIQAWRNVDPELQPLVDKARQAITRLSGAAD
ncbi:MAG: protein kinase domain-containing protein [Gemmatimonadota bacterium]